MAKGNSQINKIGIVIKQKVPEANRLAVQIATYLHEKNKHTYFSVESQELCSLALGSQGCSREEMVKTCDLIIVLGGDGTFLSIARLMQERSIPILGINMGTLGFLTEIKKQEAKNILEKVLKGDYKVSKRSLLEAWVLRKGREILRSIIVNDIVVSKAAIARIIELDVAIDKLPAITMRADGLIISTPTGSTAYSLAAGGPIVEPNVPATTITAICPHSLTLRPLVVPDSSVITIALRHIGAAIMTLDGQSSLGLENNDVIQVSKFKKHNLQIIQATDRDYFTLLREKLKYGYRD